VTALSLRYYEELRKYYYVTPTSFLELLNTFETLLDKKKKSNVNEIQRYENGVNKIK